MILRGIQRLPGADAWRGATRRRRRRRRRRSLFDVAFYVPGVGAALAGDDATPAGGAETQILMLAATLAGLGYRVALIAYGTARDLPAEYLGATVIPRPGYEPGRGVRELARICRSLWDAPAPVIVTRCAGAQVGVIALYARLTRRQMTFSLANVVDLECEKILPNRRDRLLYLLGVRLADAIVAQTSEQVNLCLATFGRRAHLINSMAQLAPARARDVPSAFLWIGRLAPYKRPEAYVELARSMPEAQFWMIAVPVASSQESDRLHAWLVQAASEVPNLELLPPRSRRELGNLILRAVASVNTAEFEGMPNVLLEAWSRGVPALALHHDPDGVIEAHGLGAFAHGSAARLTELARSQWATRNDRAELGRCCRDYIDRFHSPGAVAQRWCSILRLAPSADRAANAPASATLSTAPRTGEHDHQPLRPTSVAD